MDRLSKPEQSKCDDYGSEYPVYERMSTGDRVFLAVMGVVAVVIFVACVWRG